VAQLKSRQWEPACPHCERLGEACATSENHPLQCNSIYAMGKRNQEEMGLLFGRTYDLPVVALRYFNIYGTRQALSNLIPEWRRSLPRAFSTGNRPWCLKMASSAAIL